MLKIDHAALELLEPAERARARDLLDAYEAQLRANPLIGYRPHSKQVPFHASWDRAKCFFGGNRAGKTTAGILDDVIQAVDGAVVPGHLEGYKKWEPPFYCRIVSPDFISTMEGVIFEKLRAWVPRDQLVGGSWSRAYDKQRRRLSFKNGSWFDFMTFEQDLDKFGGAALHRVHYDEEPPENIRQECKMRLIDYGGDELFTMTPTEGMTWMFDTFYDPWTQGKLEGATVVVVDMDDNPHLGEAEKAYALEGMSAEQRAARKSGLFVSFSGLIYSEFRRNVHVVPQGPVPARATVIGSIDPGHRHMAAVLWAYLDEDDDMVVFEEVCAQGETIRDVCRQIKQVEVKHQLAPLIYVIDPAARNVMSQTGRSDQMEYMDNGVLTILGQNNVPPGINRVKERLQPNAQGRVRLHVQAHCANLIDEFRRYRWVKATRGEHEGKEAPVKKDDHGMDSLRYLVMSRPHGPDRLRDDPSLSPLERAMRDDITGRSRRRNRVPKGQFGGTFA